ncbi:MAG: substrate-binding domain-containing protein, partial [Prevotella sp.]|nr:substrate-binding domain-containing protein [Prevotella sp.]
MKPRPEGGRRRHGMAAAGLWTIFTMCLIVSSCGSPRRYTIGVAQCSEDSWRAKLNEELRTATYLYDNVDIRVVSADDNDTVQRAQIDRFIDDGVDLLIVSPNQMNSISEAVDRAYDSGIPVILLDRKTGSGKYTAFIGADNVEIGRSIGEFVATRLGGRGTVVEIQGLDGSSPAVERHRGFTDALGRYPDIHIVASPSGNWLQDSGSEVMDAVMRKDTDRQIDCVFGHNDRMAVGAYETMKGYGADVGGMLFAGVDALPGADGGIARVQDGTLTVSCIYPTGGDKVMELAMNILEGRPYNKENTLRAALVTRDNAGVMLMQAEEMARQNEYLDTLHAKIDTYLAQYNHQKVYLLLSVIIVILLIIFFIMAYRAMLMRRRMAEEAANAKLVFFTNMSHEFRTPLTLIADPVEQMLGDDNLTPRQRDRLEIVGRNARVLLRLIGEILDFRKLQNGKMKLMITRFRLSEQARVWTDCFRPVAESKGIELCCRTADGIEVVTDMYKVERICYNLLSNAIKHTRRGGTVTLTVTSDDSLGMVALSVSDTGEGIPRDKQQNIFDRFFMVNGSAADGTGIGLALVKAFAEMMGGRVTVESEPGHGATFTVLLPAEIEEKKEKKNGNDESDSGATTPPSGSDSDSDSAATADPQVLSSTTAESSDNRPLVLVVDDSDDIRTYISSLLSDRYAIISAADGSEGLRMAIENVPDLIVSDVMMPVMDGLEMCRRVKGETATSHIPVLMLTARTLEEQRAEGYDCGADAYITKPFSGKVLISRVENLLESRRRLRELFAGVYGRKGNDEKNRRHENNG